MAGQRRPPPTSARPSRTLETELRSDGFTSTRLDLGRYQIDFPPGTWTSFPVMTVTAFGVNGAYGNAIVSSALRFGDGSARFLVDITISNSPNTYLDNGFMFITAAAQATP